MIDPIGLYRLAYGGHTIGAALLRLPETKRNAVRQQIAIALAEQIVTTLPHKLRESARFGSLTAVALRVAPPPLYSPYVHSKEQDVQEEYLSLWGLVAEKIEDALKDDKSVSTRRRTWSWTDNSYRSGFELLVTASIAEVDKASIRDDFAMEFPDETAETAADIICRWLSSSRS